MSLTGWLIDFLNLLWPFRKLFSPQIPCQPFMKMYHFRLYNVPLIGSKLCILYHGLGWQTGTVIYYNPKLDKYGLSLQDDSTELIKEEDIDGVKMYFLEKPPRRNTRVDYLALSKGE